MFAELSSNINHGWKLKKNALVRTMNSYWKEDWKSQTTDPANPYRIRIPSHNITQLFDCRLYWVVASCWVITIFIFRALERHDSILNLDLVSQRYFHALHRSWLNHMTSPGTFPGCDLFWAQGERKGDRIPILSRTLISCEIIFRGRSV